MVNTELPGLPRRRIFLGMALLHVGALLALIAQARPEPKPPHEMVMQAGWIPSPVAAPPQAIQPPPKAAPKAKPVPAKSRPMVSPPAPLLAAAPSSMASTAVATPPSVASTAPAASDAPPARPAPASQTETPTPPSFAAAYLANPPPDYPRLSRELGEEGRVELRVHVSAQGLPDEISLHRGSGHERLDRAAQQAVWRWKFVPARLGQEAQAGWVIVPISFNLRK